jgi:hypothetical protein
VAALCAVRCVLRYAMHVSAQSPTYYPTFLIPEACLLNVAPNK